jgi:methylmalonyl-CoA mutase N-terminal domain/subunit
MEILKKLDNDRTISGIPLKKIYTPEDIAGLDYERDLGSPGTAPFTRGAYPNMYHNKLWRIFQLSGFGTAEDERERILYLLDQGETGFIMESDIIRQFSAVKMRSASSGLPCFQLKNSRSLWKGFPLKIYTVIPAECAPP